MSQGSWTGRTRRKTPPSVRRAEITSKFFITAGGLGTIAAVVLIFAFLLWVVVPLFGGGDLEPTNTLAATIDNGVMRKSRVDENRLLFWAVREDGTFRVARLRDGSTVTDQPLFPGATPTAWGFSPDGNDVAVGFADGTMRMGTIAFRNEFVDDDDRDDALRELEPGAWRPLPDGVVQITPERQHRTQRVETSFGKPIAIQGGGAIRQIDVSMGNHGPIAATLTANNRLSVHHFETIEDFMTGDERVEASSRDLPYEAGEVDPAYVFLTGVGNGVLVVNEDGTAQRFDARVGHTPKLAETLDLVTGNARVTAARYMTGKATLLVGDSTGTVSAWFPTRPRDAYAEDGIVLAKAHTYPGPKSPVLTIDSSRRSRIAAFGYRNGDLQVFQTTAEKRIGAGRMTGGAAVQSIALAEKDDEVVAFGAKGYQPWRLSIGHPEANLKTLFTSIWYEGYEKPEVVWQSTGGTDQFEPKLSLMPVIFGTLKATFYSILIAAPLALLAAIFTSEFLTPRARAPIKSTVEMMAGLPSVVLGFLAAMVIAPFVRDGLAATLLAFLTIPFALVVGARLWQFLPSSRAISLQGLPKVAFILVAALAGIGLAAVAAPWVERGLFDGNLLAWLDGGAGSPTGGWVFIALPISALLTILFMAWIVGPAIRPMSAKWDRRTCAIVDVLKLGVGVLLTFLGAWVLSQGLGLMWDPRQAVFGGFAKLNALVVGFCMGFAVIPIIYTLAEDALASVPRSLREASLGCGATKWQTAWRVVVPTAMSGLFSALMVGLGRAVGETMIVLMAAGNTPITEWNPFKGMRTLSANLAVELPEAVKDSTHYRVLFLCAFVLFLLTFFINTVAEFVRRTFRKRAAQL